MPAALAVEDPVIELSTVESLSDRVCRLQRNRLEPKGRLPTRLIGRVEDQQIHSE
jgi:hypothetical protein